MNPSLSPYSPPCLPPLSPFSPLQSPLFYGHASTNHGVHPIIIFATVAMVLSGGHMPCFLTWQPLIAWQPALPSPSPLWVLPVSPPQHPSHPCLGFIQIPLGTQTMPNFLAPNSEETEQTRFYQQTPSLHRAGPRTPLSAPVSHVTTTVRPPWTGAKTR